MEGRGGAGTDGAFETGVVSMATRTCFRRSGFRSTCRRDWTSGSVAEQVAHPPLLCAPRVEVLSSQAPFSAPQRSLQSGNSATSGDGGGGNPLGSVVTSPVVPTDKLEAFPKMKFAPESKDTSDTLSSNARP